MLSAYRPVLSIAGVPRLFASALLGRLPQGMSSLAILLLVRGATHSYAAAGIAVGAYALASAALAPVQGRLIDRHGRARVLLPVASTQLAVVILLVLAAHWDAGAALLVLISGIAGALVPSIAPTVRALLRDVVQEPGARESAYSLESVSQELVWILGPFLVALLVAVTTPSVALLLLGAICVTGTFVFVRSPLAAGRPVLAEHGTRSHVLANRPLRTLLGPIALIGFGLGACEVGLPSLALHAGSRSASGVLLALWSLGSLLGGLWFGSRRWQSPLPTRYRTLLVTGDLHLPTDPGPVDPGGSVRGDAGGTDDRAAVLDPVCDGRARGQGGHGDRGLHVGDLGAGGRDRRRVGGSAERSSPPAASGRRSPSPAWPRSWRRCCAPGLPPARGAARLIPT